MSVDRDIALSWADRAGPPFEPRLPGRPQLVGVQHDLMCDCGSWFEGHDEWYLALCINLQFAAILSLAEQRGYRRGFEDGETKGLDDGWALYGMAPR